MDDLYKEFIADSQDEERLQTFVVHVPTLGAREENVPGAMRVLDGPRVTHYWNGTGDLGEHFSTVLDLDGIYAWDVWMVYPADAEWEGEFAPAPDYWQHQHGIQNKGDEFDPPVLAARTRALLDQAE